MKIQLGKIQIALADIKDMCVLQPTKRFFYESEIDSDPDVEKERRHRIMIHTEKRNIIITDEDLDVNKEELIAIFNELHSIWVTFNHKVIVLRQVP